MLGINAGLKLITKLFFVAGVIANYVEDLLQKYVEFVGHRDILGERARLSMFVLSKQ